MSTLRCLVPSGRWLLLALVAQAFACPAADDGDDPDIGLCRPDAEDVADDRVPAGFDFSPNEVLSWVEGSRESAAKWGPVGPIPDGDTHATLKVTRGKGSAEALQDRCGDGPALEIPVIAELATEDGLLNEELRGQLVAPRKGFAALNVRLESADFRDRFRSLANVPQSRFLGVDLQVLLTPSDMAGGMEPLVEQRTNGGIALLAARPLLRWPAFQACSPGAVSRHSSSSDAEWTKPLRDVVDRPWVGMRDGQTIQRVALSLDERVCEYADAAVTAPAIVAVTIGETDEPLELSGEFRVDGDVTSFQLVRNGAYGARPDEFESRYGDFGLDLSVLDHVALEAEITVRGEMAEGFVKLIGSVEQCKPCTSTSECRGCGAPDTKTLMELVLRPQ